MNRRGRPAIMFATRSGGTTIDQDAVAANPSAAAPVALSTASNATTRCISTRPRQRLLRIAAQQWPRSIRLAGLVTLILAASPTMARADITWFAGTINPAAGREQVMGAAVSWFPAPIEMLRIEIERWKTRGVTGAGREVSFFGVRLLAQQPGRRRVRPYAAIGAGLYGETSKEGSGSGEASGRSIGGGAKVQLKGPLAIRLDYRLLFIDAPDAATNFAMRKHPQLMTAGLALTF